MPYKSERFGLVLSAVEKHLLNSLAEDWGESRAFVVRELIREAAHDRSLAVQKREELFRGPKTGRKE